MKINFFNLGRSNTTFSTTIASLDHANLEAAARSQCRIMSSDLDFNINEEESAGTVFAGVQNIGSFTLEPDGAELN